MPAAAAAVLLTLSAASSKTSSSDSEANSRRGGGVTSLIRGVGPRDGAGVEAGGGGTANSEKSIWFRGILRLGDSPDCRCLKNGVKPPASTWAGSNTASASSWMAMAISPLGERPAVSEKAGWRRRAGGEAGIG